MYPTNIYKMKNFANPKTMFRSCSNNDEFSTKPVQSCVKRSPRPSMVCGRSGSAGSSSGTSFKSIINASCAGSPRSEQEAMSPMDTNAVAVAVAVAGSICKTKTTTPLAMETGNAAGNTTTRNTASNTDINMGGGAAGGDNDSTSDHFGSDSIDELQTKEPHHQLNSEWTLWYLETDRSKSWEEMLHEVASFNTVENFWSLINHIKTPSEIKIGSDYCLFKKGIRPMWEDEANVRGGRWVITLNKSNKNDLDNFWLDTMLILIGESCDYSTELCGAVVNIRGKNNKISIWTANGSNEAAALEIGGKLRDGLRMESAYLLQYQLHKDTMAKQGSLVKTIYTR